MRRINWKLVLGLIALGLLLSRGGGAMLLSASRILLPVIAFVYVTKKVTDAIFPPRKKNDEVSGSSDDPNVIKICGDCGKEVNSCLKCKVGFTPKSR